MTAQNRVGHVEIAGTDLNFRRHPISDETPSGLQLSLLGGFNADDHVYVLQLRDDGEVEDVRNVESVLLTDGNRFVVAEGDRSYRLAMDGDHVDWPARFITEPTLRKLFNIADDKVILFEKEDVADEQLDEADIIDLDEPGIERFKSRKGTRKKKQNVQVKHLGELETVKFKVNEDATIRAIWERAYVELETSQDARDIIQADLRTGPVSLMEYLDLTLFEAQARNLCEKKFEIAARTGGA